MIFRKKIVGLSSASLETFLLRARRMLHFRGKVNVLVTSSTELRSLNRQFRGNDKATDVLSFPSSSILPFPAAYAGDIAISADIARQNAAQLGHPVASEVKILALHALLHMAGFDHERDNGQMARKERQLRLRLRLEPGLTERGAARRSKAAARRKSI